MYNNCVDIDSAYLVLDMNGCLRDHYDECPLGIANMVHPDLPVQALPSQRCSHLV